AGAASQCGQAADRLAALARGQDALRGTGRPGRHPRQLQVAACPGDQGSRLQGHLRGCRDDEPARGVLPQAGGNRPRPGLAPVAVQADQAPVVGVARRKRRRGQLGLAGGIVVAGAAAAAIYLVMAPLLALLATAFRGPSDLLPFEPGAHWTLDNLVDVYVSTPLLSRVLPNTAIFVAGSVTVTFLTAFTLAWLVERTDLPWRTTLFTAILFPLLVPGVVMAFAWTLLFAPNAGWINVMLRGVLGLGSPGPINIFSMPGLILCQGIASVPFVFLLLGAAMRT